MCNCGAARNRNIDVNSLPRQRGAPVPVRVGPVIHDPAVWGPHMWTAMHTLAVFIPFHVARAEWIELLTPLAVSLPCPECAGHYGHWLGAHPLVIKRRPGPMMMVRRAVPAAEIDIGAWLMELHNAVNGRKGVSGWNMDAVNTAYGGDVGARRDAVRAAIDAVRGMIGARAIAALERLLTRM